MMPDWMIEQRLPMNLRCALCARKMSVCGAALASTLLATMIGCATSPQPPPAPPPSPPAHVPTSEFPPNEAEAETEPPPPASWREVLERSGSRCPVPFFEMSERETITLGASTFTLTGSVLKREGERWQGPLRIGVLGALQDAEPDTRDNVRRAMGRFKAAGVHFVLINGDVVAHDPGAMGRVMRMLGEELPLPVFLHSGNYEWTSAFTEALAEAQATHSQLVNMNIVRDVDLGGVHLVSLPGYHDRHFMRPAACHYKDADLEELRAHLQGLTSRGEVVILTSHGPPHTDGGDGIDFAHEAGNVGDDRVTQLIVETGVPYGIFSHILEAGGRADDDLTALRALTVPMKGTSKRLYVNVGSANSSPWRMLDGSASRGKAAIFTVDLQGGGHEATVQFLELR